MNGADDRALVESLLVAPKLRGRGLGRKLMVAAEEHVRRQGSGSRRGWSLSHIDFSL